MARLAVVLTLTSLVAACAEPGSPSDLFFDDDVVDVADVGADATDLEADDATLSSTDAGRDVIDLPEAVPMTLALGRGEPFVEWREAGELPVVAGIQGGFHTEHVALLSGFEPADLDSTIIIVEVARNGVELARGAWLFNRRQYDAGSVGWTVRLPPVIFDDDPEIGSAVDLFGSVELVDGGILEFERSMTLVEE